MPKPLTIERAVQAASMRARRLSWAAIASELGFVSGKAALHAATRYGGFRAPDLAGVCGDCEVSLPRSSGYGRLREYCDEHSRARRNAAARVRLRTSRSPAACLDCGAMLADRTRKRCEACGQRRRRDRERARDHRRAGTKSARARKVGYTSRHWKTVRDAAVAAAGCCARCGAAGDLTGHLANERLRGDHRLATLDDVEVLCRSCHGRLRT